MLCRAAENMYWMARHLERIENTARLVDVTSQARLDWSDGAWSSWRTALVVTGTLGEFEGRGLERSDENVVRFLLCDARSASSILSLSALARDNNRALIELLPRESWEEINALHHLARASDAAAPPRRDEHLREVIGRAQAMAGLFLGALNDDDGTTFLRLGRAVERGEFAARMLLASAEAAGDGLADADRLRAADWVGVLGSLTAFQMYRRSVQGPVTGPRVIRFLTCSTAFPRALAFCAKEAELTLARLPGSAPLVAAAARLSSGLRSGCLEARDGVSTDLVSFGRNGLLDLHGRIAATYFSPQRDPSEPTPDARAQGRAPVT